MKKWLSILLVFASTLCSAHDEGISWEDLWVAGIAHCTERNFEVGIDAFSHAIEMLEEQNIQNFANIYVDRGRALLMVGDYYHAFLDLDFAMNTKTLTIKDQVRAITGRLVGFSNLGMNIETLKELELLKASDPNFPQTIFSEHYIIIRNIPENRWYRETIKCLLIHSNLCESKNNIFICPSGTLVAVRKCHCGCDCCIIRDGEKQYCDQCGIPLQFTGIMSPEDALSNCNELTTTSIALCTEAFKKTSSRLVGFYVVDFIRQAGLNSCVYDEMFYDRCMIPFRNLAKAPETPANPIWD